jgi:hypothetical protein
MQPLHAEPGPNLDSIWARNAGAERAGRGFSWASLERAGARLVFGSDWPVVTSDVLRGLYCAVTRKSRDGQPAAGWLPEQAVTLESALRHYTIDAAYASFEEEIKGSVKPGKLADLVVLSQDLFKTAPEQILKTRVVATIVGGRVVYRTDSPRLTRGRNASPTTRVTRVSAASSQVSLTAAAWSAAVGEGRKKRRIAKAMKPVVTITAAQASPGPPGIR